MATPVIMPKFGQSVETCILTKWYKKAGEEIKKGEIIFAYETDKASFEEESKEDGILLATFFEEGDEVIVVAELAGFSRENLKVTAKDHQLILSAEALDRRYRKSLNLPSQVIPNTLCTTYKNGVLEVRLKKAVEKRAIDKIAGLGNAT